MKIEPFKTWKIRFMKDTDPKTGSKIAVQFNDCHETKLHRLRFLDEIEEIEFYIRYRSGKKSDSVITFQKIEEFEKAQRYAAYHSYPCTNLIADGRMLMINEGYANLEAIFPYSEENIQKFKVAGIPLDSNKNKTYNGRPINVK